MPRALDSSLRSGGLALTENLTGSQIRIVSAALLRAVRIPVLLATGTSARAGPESLRSNVMATSLHSSGEKAARRAGNSGRVVLEQDVLRVRAGIARLSSLVDPSGPLNVGADLRALRAALHPGVVLLVGARLAVDLLAVSLVRPSGRFGNDLRRN